jgi:hypothetical protein
MQTAPQQNQASAFSFGSHAINQPQQQVAGFQSNLQQKLNLGHPPKPQQDQLAAMP